MVAVFNGVVAVADICNTDYAVPVKNKSELYWHNLIEVINLHDENQQKQINHFKLVLEQHKILDAEKATTTFTPHAPYSVSAETFKALNKATTNSVISIHNQESRAEDEYYFIVKEPQAFYLCLRKAVPVLSALVLH